MVSKLFKTPPKKSAQKYKNFYAPFLSLYLPERKSLIKNYIIEPEIRVIKSEL